MAGDGRFWVQERMHHPDPVGRLEFWLIDAFTAGGLNAVARRLGLPVEVRMRHIGGYVYQATTPVAAADDPQERLLAAADRLAADWRAVLLPEIRGLLAAWDAHDPTRAAPDEVLRQLDETLARVRRLGEIHFLVALPGLAATSALVDAHAELFPRDGPLGAHGLLRGLLRSALDAFAGAPPPPAGERERLIARVRARLDGDPRAARFERLLSAAEAWAVLEEEHAEWIDVRGLDRARAFLLAVGDRLGLERRADVLLLAPSELRALVAGEAVEPALIARRRAELRRAAALEPRPAVGTPPQGPPPDTPLLRTIGRFLGTPPAPSGRATVNGHPGAPGRARGAARVVRRPGEAGGLRPGDVLVAPTTGPAWTPLFATVAAVVTDTGGALSHAATVAREYGIPAVVGATGATARIADGRPVEVDGEAGVVRLL